MVVIVKDEMRTCMYCRKKVKMYIDNQPTMIRVVCPICKREDEIILKRNDKNDEY